MKNLNTYFLDIAKPPRVVLLSYTGRFFVYCLLFTDLFKKESGIFFDEKEHNLFFRPSQKFRFKGFQITGCYVAHYFLC